MPARLRLLGPPRLEVNGTTTDLPVDRPASLAYYLTVRGDWVRRGELAYLYYPDADESLAFGNLRRLIHRLKQFDWARALETDQTRVRLPFASDVHDFRAALEQKDFVAALKCYGGTFLEGVSFPDLAGFEAWLELEREELKRTWRTATLESARELESRGAFAEAEHAVSALLRTDPLDEDAVQALLRVLQSAGERTRALEVFDRFQADLRRELQAEPLEATRALVDSFRRASQASRLKASTPDHANPEATPAQPRHNLPAATTRFIGRKRELEQLARYIGNPDCRLLTLIGLGGMGKTRLALEAISQQVKAFPDGVWFVPLAGVASADLLIPSIAAAVGLSFSGPNDPKTQLLNYLREKQMLLLLDNFEHVRDGSVLLEELIAAAPALKLIVTSRVVLELGSEWLFDLEGLSYPPADARESFGDYDAVRLFVGHAERLSSTFVAEGPTLEAIAELCRQVQGMPLALELAVSWTRSLSVTELARTLGRNFDLLSTTRRDVPERQRNLHAILEYTWSFLTEGEQSALSNLSVFRGGFTLEAAQAVAGTHLGLLMRFINLALVRRDQDGRYDMHELVRQFTAERLTQTGASPNTHALHGQFFANLAHQLARESRGPTQEQALAQLNLELPNLKTAWDQTLHDGLEALESLGHGLSRLFDVRGRFREGLDTFARGLNVLDGQDEQFPDVKAKLQLEVGRFTRRLGLDRDAQAVLHESLRHLSQTDDVETHVQALQELGATKTILGDYANAEADFQRSLTLLDQHDNLFLRGVSLEALGNLADRQSDPLRAKDLYQQSLALARQSEDLRGTAHALQALGGIEEKLGNVDEAIRLKREAQPMLERLGDRHGMAEALLGLGNTTIDQGRTDEAEHYYKDALELFQHMGNRLRVAATFNNLGGVAFARGDLEAMKGYIQEALNIRRELGDKNGIARCLTNLAMVHQEQRDMAQARALHLESLTIKQQLGDLEGMAACCKGIGVAARESGDHAAARQAFNACIRLAWQASNPGRVLDGLEGLTSLLVLEGKSEQASLYIGLLLEHPANTESMRELAREMLNQLRQNVPHDDLERWLAQGNALDLEEVWAQVPPDETSFLMNNQNS